MKKAFYFVILLMMTLIALLGCSKKTYVEHTGYFECGVAGAKTHIRQEYVLHYNGPDAYNTEGGLPAKYLVQVQALECEFIQNGMHYQPPLIKITSTSFFHGVTNPIVAGSTISFYVECFTSIHKSVTFQLAFGETILWEGTLDLNKF